MGPQRYERIQHDDDDDTYDHDSTVAPSSPPPSFHSRASSPTSRRLLHQDSLREDANQDLEDTFDDGEASDAENDGDDRQRLMRADSSRNVSTSVSAPHTNNVETEPTNTPNGRQIQVERRVTEIPAFTPRRPPPTSNRGPKPTNDGVFANLSAKPTPGEPLEDKPPTYEQAAADATPPYWETTILAPGMSSDEVYVDGLPVGSVFSFVWNGMISVSFQFVGFMLTYLLHTTHAAKNGSRAGLGLTLVQFGFYMRRSASGGADSADPGQFAGSPPDPNSHTFDPNNPTDTGGAGSGSGTGASSGFSSGDLISYALMIVGWFILIRAVSDFLRARRHEQLVLQSPTRGLNVPVVAEGEGERAA